MDFKDTFTEANDIIYGIGAWITRYIIYYLHNQKYLPGTKIPDNLWSEAHQKKEQSHFAINTFNTFISSSTYQSNTGTLAMALGTASVGKNQAYATAIQQSPNLSPKTTEKATPDQLQSLQKSNRSLKSDSNQSEVYAAAKDLAIRRSSKFGIEHVTETLNGKVHYILDEVDMSVVLDKKDIQNTSGYTKMPIVSSELRYLFRNWNRYKGSGKVIFWKEFKDCKAPWDTADKEKWAMYALDRLLKYIKQVQKDDEWKEELAVKDLAKQKTRVKLNVEKLLGNDAKKKSNAHSFLQSLDANLQTADDIIKYFHSIPYSLVNKEHLVTQ